MGTDLACRPVGHNRPVRGPDRSRTIIVAHETKGVPDEASNYSKVRSTPLARSPESDHSAVQTAQPNGTDSATCAARWNLRSGSVKTPVSANCAGKGCGSTSPTGPGSHDGPVARPD